MNKGTMLRGLWLGAWMAALPVWALEKAPLGGAYLAPATGDVFTGWTRKQVVKTQEALLDRTTELERALAESRREQARLERENENLRRQVEALQKEKDLQEVVILDREMELQQARNTAVAPMAGDPHRPAPIQPPPARAESNAEGERIASPPPPVLPESAATPAKAETSRPAGPSEESTPYREIANGNRFLKNGQAAEAEQCFRAALKQDPMLVGARLGLAACRYSTGDILEAKNMIEDLIKTDPGQSQAYGLLGIIAWRENDIEGAADALNKAIRMDPEDAQLRNYMGIVQHTRTRTEDAAREFREAIRLDPQLAEAQYNLAVVLTAMKPPLVEEALPYYQEAIRLGNARDTRLEQIFYPP